MLKKSAVFIIFLMIFSLLTPSCTNKLQEPQYAFISNGENLLEDNVSLVRGYGTFEDTLNGTSSFLKAEFVSQEQVEGKVSYVFKVLDCYFGTAEEEFVHVRKTVGEEIVYADGKAYYLLLQHRGNTFSGDVYVVPSWSLCLPVNDLSNATMYGELLLKHSKIERLDTESDLISYVLDYFKNYNISGDRYFGTPYVKSDKIEDIVLGSDVVLRVRISEKPLSPQSAVNEFYKCTITEILKGDDEVGREFNAVFEKDSLMVGEEYIITFNVTEPGFEYHLSSKLGIYDLSRQEEILQYLTAENAG